MTREEYFRKNYPDSCYGDKPLSPYWDLFQAGVEFGERQSEKQIAELEETNERIASKYYELQETLKNANRAMVKELDDMTSGGVSVLENVVRSKEQLTKAKKIIKNLLDVAKFYNHYRDKGAVMDIKPIYDAEQFLKEVV